MRSLRPPQSPYRGSRHAEETSTEHGPFGIRNLEFSFSRISRPERRDRSRAFILEILVNGIVGQLQRDQEGILANERRRYAMLWILVRTNLLDRNVGAAQRTNIRRGPRLQSLSELISKGAALWHAGSRKDVARHSKIADLVSANQSYLTATP